MNQQHQIQQKHYTQHKNPKFFLISFFIFLALLQSSQSFSSSSCASQNHLNCLTKQGECTDDINQCASQCQFNNNCSSDCCLNEFCLFNKFCDSDSENNTAIPTVIISVVLCAIFSILICCAWRYIWRCIYRIRLKKAFQNQQSIRVVAQIPSNNNNNNNGDVDNNIQMGQIPSGLNDREQLFDNAILIQQGQVIGHNNNFAGRANPIPINIVYLHDASSNESDGKNTSKQMKIIPSQISSSGGNQYSKNNRMNNDNKNNNIRVFPTNEVNSYL